MEPTNHEFRTGPDDLPPRQAWLMAYLDGELPPEERARVTSWIAEDPDAYHQLEEERRRREIFSTVPPPEPSPAAWDATLARIEAALQQPTRAPGSKRGRGSVLWLAVGLTAAAALAGIWLAGALLFGPEPHPPGQPPPEGFLALAAEDDVQIDEMDPLDARALVVGRLPRLGLAELGLRRPFPILSASEVLVETMDGNDTPMLVVGEPPVEGALVMAQPGEVKVDRIELADNKDEPKPYLWEPGGGGMPMINVRLKTVRRD